MCFKFIIPFRNNWDFHYYDCLYNSLQIYCNKNNIELITEFSETDNGMIYMNNIPKAYCIVHDQDELNKTNLEIINKYNPDIIFKYVYNNNYNYNNHKIISAGYFSPLFINMSYNYIYENINNRNIDISSRMNSNTDGNRFIIQKMCFENRHHYNIKMDIVQPEIYWKELPNVKIGFNWRGGARINFRLIEYLAFGICIISDDLTYSPIRGDIFLKHEENCIFVKDSRDFIKETKLLLKDKQKMNKMSKNNYELYIDKLTPYKMGEWYIQKLLNI